LKLIVVVVLLGCWITGLLGCWVAGLLGCRKAKSADSDLVAEVAGIEGAEGVTLFEAMQPKSVVRYMHLFRGSFCQRLCLRISRQSPA
jgi:hypothetical protein